MRRSACLLARVLLAGALLGVAGCASAGHATGVRGAMGQPGADRGTQVELHVGGDGTWHPDRLDVPANSDVTLRITNDMAHTMNFSLPSAKVSQDLPAGELVTVRFAVPAPGRYRFYDKYMGMAGVITAR
jgi:heme/copper-type cytochrome/quinol oxidase subunit 2